MPELPEVETVCRQLDAAVAGRRVRGLAVNDPKLAHLEPTDLTGCRIESVTRRGKQVVFNLIPPRSRSVTRWLVVHLRMTGRLLVAGRADAPVARTPRFILELDRGAVLFSDTRRFGTAFVTANCAATLPAGLDPTLPEFNWRVLEELIAGSTTPLKAWLLRQDRLVGIGNIYASEICFRAGVHPSTPAGALDDARLKAVARATKAILTAAIRHCGTTFSDFQDTTGSTGGYVKYLKVYGREEEPCRKCGTPIERFTQAQRSTYLCPHCQPFGE